MRFIVTVVFIFFAVTSLFAGEKKKDTIIGEPIYMMYCPYCGDTVKAENPADLVNHSATLKLDDTTVMRTCINEILHVSKLYARGTKVVTPKKKESKKK